MSCAFVTVFGDCTLTPNKLDRRIEMRPLALIAKRHLEVGMQLDLVLNEDSEFIGPEDRATRRPRA
jgi:hypothetical protein